jgi:outer membrane lipoprotein-sorting protein
VKESSAADDYTHRLLGQEDIGSFHCYKIEMTPTAGAAVVWEKVIVWIDRKEYIQLKGEFYGEGNRVENTMISSDVRMLGGRMLPARLEMIPAEKPGQKTVIVYKSLIFDKPVDDSFFSVENMTKIR